MSPCLKESYVSRLSLYLTPLRHMFGIGWASFLPILVSPSFIKCTITPDNIGSSFRFTMWISLVFFLASPSWPSRASVSFWAAASYRRIQKIVTIFPKHLCVSEDGNIHHWVWGFMKQGPARACQNLNLKCMIFPICQPSGSGMVTFLSNW